MARLQRQGQREYKFMREPGLQTRRGERKSWKIRLQCVDFDRIYRHHRSRFWSERTSDRTSIPLLWLLCGRTNRHIWFLGFQGGCCSHSDETRQVSSVKGAKRGERSNRTDALKDPPPPKSRWWMMKHSEHQVLEIFRGSSDRLWSRWF